MIRSQPSKQQFNKEDTKMKKLFILFAFIALAIGVNAQSGFPADALSAFSKTSDTVTNTETVYMTLPLIKGHYNLSIQPYILNKSGTTAISVRLEGKIGNIWTTLNANNTSSMIAATDTLAAIGTTSTVWYLESNLNYYRVAFVSTGTHVSWVYAAYVLKSIM
jgi:hypothetical protein